MKKNISIEIKEQKPELTSLSFFSEESIPQISINQINVLITSKQYKAVIKKMREISKILNQD